jgi:arylsulfatase A-like enzyme
VISPTELDDNLGRVFRALEETGQASDTVVILTADHGDQLGDHWIQPGVKTGWFDQSYHVPLIVADPRPVADGGRGSIVKAFTEHVDVVPTILETVFGARANLPRQCDGSSLRPFVEGRPPLHWRDFVCWEFDFRWTQLGKHPATGGGWPTSLEGLCLAVLRDATHKYVHFGGGAPLVGFAARDHSHGYDSFSRESSSGFLPPLLYDVRPGGGAELVNLAAQPEHASTVLAYAQRMLRCDAP